MVCQDYYRWNDLQHASPKSPEADQENVTPNLGMPPITAPDRAATCTGQLPCVVDYFGVPQRLGYSARRMTSMWRYYSNHARPHSALNGTHRQPRTERLRLVSGSKPRALAHSEPVGYSPVELSKQTSELRGTSWERRPIVEGERPATIQANVQMRRANASISCFS